MIQEKNEWSHLKFRKQHMLCSVLWEPLLTGSPSLFLSALVKGAGRSVQFHQLQLYRHEMQHFVKVIQGYLANQILQVSWREFTAKLATASDLDAIHRTHADYLNRAIFRWGLGLRLSILQYLVQDNACCHFWARMIYCSAEEDNLEQN